MRLQLWNGIELIGVADLTLNDWNMGIVDGQFEPTPAYELVRPVFLLYTESMPGSSRDAYDGARLSQFYAARDALNLRLTTEAGEAIASEGLIIVDWSATAPEEPYEIMVHINDETLWDR